MTTGAAGRKILVRPSAAVMVVVVVVVTRRRRQGEVHERTKTIFANKSTR